MRADTEMTLHRLNRLARQVFIGASDAVWLEDRRQLHGIAPSRKYSVLISALQDVYALKAVEERLKQ